MPHRAARLPWTAACLAFALAACSRGDGGSNGASAQNAASQPGSPAAGPTATEFGVVRAMLDMAQVGSSDLVMDLGSGDGRIPIMAAKEKGARGIGIELNPQLIRQANANATREGVGTRVEFRQQDLFVTPLNDVTVLTLYLLPEINLQLRPKILQQMRPGARVVSNSFDMADWRADQTRQVGSTTIHMWTVPAQVAGRYGFQLEGGQGSLVLQQRFQDLSGTANLGEGDRPITNARLQGADIQFQVDGRLYRGRVSGNMIEGQDWRAVKTG